MNDDISYVFFEGSIGVGKTTLLARIEARLRARGLPGTLLVVPEPVDTWRDVDGHNVLGAFYAEPRRWAYDFQVLAMSTRVAAVRRAIDDARHRGATGPLVLLCERSVYSDRYVFLEMLVSSGSISAMERAMYVRAFDFFTSLAYPGRHAGVVYLDAAPATCLARLRARDRAEETTVPLAYLEQLAATHAAAFAVEDAWHGAPMLRLDTDAIGNIATDDAAADAAAAAIGAFLGSQLGL